MPPRIGFLLIMEKHFPNENIISPGVQTGLAGKNTMYRIVTRYQGWKQSQIMEDVE